MSTTRKKGTILRLLLAALLAAVLIVSALGAVADQESEILENRSGRVDLTDMTTDLLVITGAETADRTLVVSIGAGCDIGTVRVENGAYLLISADAKVGSVQVVNPVDLYLNGAVEDITAADGAFVFIEGSVETMEIGNGTYVRVKEDATIGTLNVESAEIPSVIEVDGKASVNTVNITAGEATIGGVGHVETVNAGGESKINVEASITTLSGAKTEIAKEETANAVYLAEELFTMAIDPFENVVLNKTMKLTVKVADVIGVPVAAELSVTSSDESVISATLDGATLILERKAPGKAFITIRAKMAGYLDTTASFCVYKNAELETAVRKIDGEIAKTKSTVPVDLFCGNACNKSLIPGDTSVISGITAPEGATVSVVSSNPAVAQVSAVTGGSFTITAIQEGMTTVTITASMANTDTAIYTPSVQKILILVDQPEAVRTQLTAALPSEKDLTKVYDGATSINLPEPQLTGVKEGDDVHVVAIACYTDSQAGSGKTVNISYHLYGDHANAYISPADVVVHNGKINKRSILVSADAVEREYIPGDLRVELENIQYTGVVSGDRAYVDSKTAYGQLSDALVGEGKAVTCNRVFLIGEDAANYTLVLPNTVVVDILKCQVAKPVLASTQTYTGSELTADIPTNELYTISGDKQTAAGSYNATISLVDQANYRWADDTSNDITVPYSITSKSLTGNISPIVMGNVTYTGSALTPKPVVTDSTLGTLTETRDYTLSHSDNINAGQATVTVTGTGNYQGTVIGHFTIDPKSVASGVTIGQIPMQYYTGSAITPTSVVVTDTARNTALTVGTDFTFSYSNNTQTGNAAYIIVNGTGNYTGTTQKTFTIGPKAMTTSFIRIGAIPAQVYTGSTITPAVTITDTNLSYPLVLGKDYTISYTNNVNAGTCSVEIDGIGNYSGTMNTSFTINKADPTLSITSASTLDCGRSLQLACSTNSTGKISWSLGTHTTNTSLSGSTLTMGYTGSNSVSVTVAATGNFNSKTVSGTVTGILGSPIINSVSASPSQSFDSNFRDLVSFSANVSNPSSASYVVHYTVSRNNTSQGSFVYTNGSTANNARMAIGSYTVTAYATNEYGTSHKSCTVTVNPSASVPSQSGSAAGHDCTLVVTNTIPAGKVTGYSFQFTTASGHSGSDNWYVTVYYSGGSSAQINSGTAYAGVSKTVSSLNMTGVSRMEFFYHVDSSHGNTCLGTNMSASITVSIPENNSQTSPENASTISDGSFTFGN